MELNIVRMNNEEVNFNIRDVMKHLFNLDYCLKIGVVYQLVEEGVSRHTSFTPFKHVVVNVIENLDEAKQDEKKDCLTWLESQSLEACLDEGKHDVIKEKEKTSKECNAKIDTSSLGQWIYNGEDSSYQQLLRQ